MGDFDALAEAILKQAIDDYRRALLIRRGYIREAQIKEIETFLLSPFGEALSMRQGEKIVNILRRERKRIDERNVKNVAGL